MLLPCGHDIDSGGIDTAVTQDVGQLGNVLFDAVEGPGKQLSQIVGKHLAFLNTGSFAQLLHLPPDAAAVQRLPLTVLEDHPGGDLFFFGVA